MWTVKKASDMTGVSMRTLRYYDTIGLLKPETVTDAGYRLYGEESMARLGQILLLRELGFRLQEIKEILDDPDFDREKALDQQIKLLSLKKERMEAILSLAKEIRKTGVYKMDFQVFDKQKIESYAAEAKKQWGQTEAYREYEEKTAGDSDEKKERLAAELMGIFAQLGTMREKSPADPGVQTLVGKLQKFITENYYTCTEKILSGLGQMYKAGGEMTDHIDAAGGKGTAAFVSDAIAQYCRSFDCTGE